MILDTPGCCAREEIGAFEAGVFCGVLVCGGVVLMTMSRISKFARKKYSRSSSGLAFPVNRLGHFRVVIDGRMGKRYTVMAFLGGRGCCRSG